MSEEEKTKNCKTDALDYIDRNAGEIAKIGDAVFYFAELGMQEFKTSEFTADALRKAGFDVDAGISGIPPAWMASWGSGKPVIGIHCEADAIPKSSQIPGITEERPLIEGGAPGHAEGHNTNIAAMIGAAVAAKKAMEKNNIKGTIKLFFAPAEEQNISRPLLFAGRIHGRDRRHISPARGKRSVYYLWHTPVRCHLCRIHLSRKGRP